MRCRKIHGIKTGRTKPVDLHARHRNAIARGQCGRATNIAARLANRIHTTEHDIIDLMGIERVAFADCAQRNRCERKGGDLMERPIRLATTAGRSGMIENKGIGHFWLLDRAENSNMDFITVPCVAAHDKKKPKYNPKKSPPCGGHFSNAGKPPHCHCSIRIKSDLRIRLQSFAIF